LIQKIKNNMKHFLKILLKILIIFPIVFGIIKVTDYFFGSHNKIISISISILIIVIIEKILIKIYGKKMEDFLNKWFF